MRYSIGAPSIDIPQRLQRRNMKNVCNLLFNFTYAIDNHHVRIRSEASRVFIEQSFEAGAEALGNEDERVLQVQIFVIVVPFFFVVSTNCLFGHVDKSTGENMKNKIEKSFNPKIFTSYVHTVFLATIYYHGEITEICS